MTGANATPGATLRRTLTGLNVAARAAMEAGLVLALAAWGYSRAGSGPLGVLVGACVAAVAFGFWGAVDFRGRGRWAEPLRLTQELLLTALATVAWHAAGQQRLAWILGGLSAAHHALLYALGGRLLDRPAGRGRAAGSVPDQQRRDRVVHPQVVALGARPHQPGGLRQEVQHVAGLGLDEGLPARGAELEHQHRPAVRPQ